MESLEISARTVAEAIEKALLKLGKTRDEVEVSVLAEGSRGILGIGGEDARILVSPREMAHEAPVASPAASHAEPLSRGQVAELAQSVLENLLGGMRVDAAVETREVPPSAAQEGFVASLDVVQPEDVGILIGRRGETLSSLQFLTTLIVARKVGRWGKILVDVEGYRARREASLRNLATRIATRVQETRQPMALEAMPANERRIVHLALQDHPAVSTASTGEGDQRRVIISPRR